MTNRVELSTTERFPFADGHEFGAVGPYERLVGRAHFAVDPHAPAQHGITDVASAPPRPLLIGVGCAAKSD